MEWTRRIRAKFDSIDPLEGLKGCFPLLLVGAAGLIVVLYRIISPLLGGANEAP